MRWLPLHLSNPPLRSRNMLSQIPLYQPHPKVLLQNQDRAVVRLNLIDLSLQLLNCTDFIDQDWILTSQGRHTSVSFEIMFLLLFLLANRDSIWMDWKMRYTVQESVSSQWFHHQRWHVNPVPKSSPMSMMERSRCSIRRDYFQCPDTIDNMMTIVLLQTQRCVVESQHL